MIETLRQIATSLTRYLVGGGEREPGRRFDRVERDLALHDHTLIQQQAADLPRRQQHWLVWAGDILAVPNAPDAKVGEALDFLRQLNRNLHLSGLLLVPLRLDDPAYEDSRQVPDIDPSWLTPSVRGVAEDIHRERCFAELPVLADALEDAGCTDPDILDPMRRQPTPHIRAIRVLYALRSLT